MKKYLLTIVAVVMIFNFAYSQTDINLKAVGGKVGFVMPEDPIDNTLGFGVTADLGTIMPQIHLGGFFEFWSKSYDVNLGFGKQEWSWSEFILGGTARYFFPMEGELKPYAGAGLAFIIGRFSWDYSGPAYGGATDDSDSEIDIGVHISGGIEYILSDTMTGFAEAKYTIDGADYFGIFVGAQYKLKK